jgi:hypothetical protein
MEFGSKYVYIGDSAEDYEEIEEEIEGVTHKKLLVLFYVVLIFVIFNLLQNHLHHPRKQHQLHIFQSALLSLPHTI